MKKTISVLISVLLLSVSVVFADDVSIDSNGNVTTGANAGANLEVTGASVETAISGISFDSGGTGVSGAHYTGQIVDSAGYLGIDQTGVYGYGQGWAGYFQGHVRIENDLTVDGRIIGLDAAYVNEGQLNSITSDMITNGEIGSDDLGINYATSSSKGGPALDLACSACVSMSELSFTPSLSGHNHDADYVNLTGDSMTGDLNVEGEYKIYGEAFLKAVSANTSVGKFAGAVTTNLNDNHNTFMGYSAGASFDSFSSGSYNTFIGANSGSLHNNGHNNTFIGSAAGGFKSGGHFNTFIGNSTGFHNIIGDGNVFLGYAAGYSETGSNKLYIANGQYDYNVLIYGDFGQTLVGIGTVTPSATLDVRNLSDNKYGLIGSGTEGVYGQDSLSTNWGRLGSSLYGVEGYSDTGTGVHGQSGSGTGVSGESTSGTGGYFSSSTGYGLIVNNGNVGIFTNTPAYELDVNGNIFANGSQGFDAAGETAGIYFGHAGHSILAEHGVGIRISAFGAPNAITIAEGSGTVGIPGELQVNGAIVQRAAILHADYVFDPAYDLETIEEHAEYMWSSKHLKAIPARQVDENGLEVIDVGNHRRGIVEELEKAHIYIEQLHTQMEAQNSIIQVLEKRLAKLEEN